MEKRWDIFGIGTAAVDDLIYLDQFPRIDEKMPIQLKRRQAGGQTATALVAAVRHGASASFCARLGTDDLSIYSIEELEREGVDCSTVIRGYEGKPFHAIVIVDQSTGVRTILYDEMGVVEPDPEMINPLWITNSRLLFVDQNTPHSALFAARIAQKHHIPVIADIESIKAPEIEELIPIIDYLIVGIGFARQWTHQARIEDAVQALHCQERLLTAVTYGDQGCWYIEAGSKEIGHIPAVPVKAVDTTGCGDIFHGVFAAAIIRGESNHYALELANAAAGLKAARLGGRAGIPDLHTVEEYLKGVNP